MPQILLLNKPFGVLSQFTDDGDRTTLKKFIQQPGFYPAGRLDYDSEGLLLLTNDGQLQHQISNPKFKLSKTYCVQVEGEITEQALSLLRQGVELKDGKTKPAKAHKLETVDFWPRNPPIRQRQNIPTSWLQLSIKEGKNRQVRRMTAAVGFPTLRLIRTSIGNWELKDLRPGETRLEDVFLPKTSDNAPSRSRRRNRKRN